MKDNKLVLDYSKWRCGEHDRNKLGMGPTLLENYAGYRCCLGQFAIQLGVPEERIIGLGEPDQLAIRGLDSIDISLLIGRGGNTVFSVMAININDDPNTSIESKIEDLTGLCRRNGYELEVINKPS